MRLSGLKVPIIFHRKVVEELLSEFHSRSTETFLDGRDSHPGALDGSDHVQTAAPLPVAWGAAEALIHGFVENVPQRREGSGGSNSGQRRERGSPGHRWKQGSKSDLESKLRDLGVGIWNQNMPSLRKKYGSVGSWESLLEQGPQASTIVIICEQKRSIGGLKLEVG